MLGHVWVILGNLLDGFNIIIIMDVYTPSDNKIKKCVQFHH